MDHCDHLHENAEIPTPREAHQTAGGDRCPAQVGHQRWKWAPERTDGIQHYWSGGRERRETVARWSSQLSSPLQPCAEGAQVAVTRRPCVFKEPLLGLYVVLLTLTTPLQYCPQSRLLSRLCPGGGAPQCCPACSAAAVLGKSPAEAQLQIPGKLCVSLILPEPNPFWMGHTQCISRSAGTEQILVQRGHCRLDAPGQPLPEPPGPAAVHGQEVVPNFQPQKSHIGVRVLKDRELEPTRVESSEDAKRLQKAMTHLNESVPAESGDSLCFAPSKIWEIGRGASQLQAEQAGAGIRGAAPLLDTRRAQQSAQEDKYCQRVVVTEVRSYHIKLHSGSLRNTGPPRHCHLEAPFSTGLKWGIDS
ncbi:hypothetical protein NFI96_019741 [Prochilodus magdalenae]|nr:hypothetical protein NFI96_019741 [Prochilodus magdalenae]